jgi:hypothetical protein
MGVEAGIFEIAFDRDERVDVPTDDKAGRGAAVELRSLLKLAVVPPTVWLPWMLTPCGTITPASTPA